MRRHHFASVGILALAIAGCVHAAAPVTTQNPILFVTQVPVPADFTTIGSVFGNQLTDMQSATRGGDLYIRYPDGTLKNLTAAAGFGSAGGQQGANSIAVRDPAPHWSGTKAIFSMVIGAPLKQFEVDTFYWQLYEITGMGQGETPVITKVPNQPANFNNINPTYGTDERIIFTSDRPRDGSPHLYPQLDEYEEAPVVSGLWSLDPATGDLFIMSHNPSGNFTPIIDSAGRVIYTRWDHLQRDQQTDADAGGNTYGTFNYSSEAANATIVPRAEVFPEPRSSRTDLLAGTNLIGNSFNQFFPWQITEDGTDEETLNHIGRHELYGFFTQVFNDDPNLKEFDGPPATAVNQEHDQSFLHIREDPNNPGLFYATDAPEFFTHSGGRIVTITGKMGLSADKMVVTSITDPSTASFINEGTTPPPNNSGHYRNAIPLTDGQLIAMHTGEARIDMDIGTNSAPRSRYDWRLYEIVTSNGNAYKTAGRLLTSGISKSVTWWSPDVLRNYSGPLWEMGPVELVARTKPARLTFPLPTPEKNVLAAEGVDEAGLRAFLRTKNLAILVSRNVTTRDNADHQQPFNLRVLGTTTQTLGNGGKLYDIAHQQYFQADQIRGLGIFNTGDTPKEGRRVLAQVMHDTAAINPVNSDGPVGSVQIASDGSTAAFVPARRAMTWQLTDGSGTPVVRERYWLTFAPGEIRSCTSCHGLNTKDQAGNPTPVNEPLALHKLLQFYKAGGANGLGPGSTPGDADSDGFPDALEVAYGSSPSDPNSTPFGGAPAGAIQPLKLSRFDIKLNFAKSGQDQVTLGGTLNVPAGFAPSKTEVFIFTGGVAQHFFLDGKGAAKTATASCKLSLKAKKGQVLAQTSKFSAMFHKGTLAAGFAAANLTGTADVKNSARTVQIFLLFNKTVYELDAPIVYSAKKGKTGTGKLKTK